MAILFVFLIDEGNLEMVRGPSKLPATFANTMKD